MKPLTRLLPPFPRREGGPGGLGETLRLLAEKLPLFALAAASAAVTLLAQHRAAGVRRVPELSLRVENALVSCVTYLGQAVWPLPAA